MAELAKIVNIYGKELDVIEGEKPKRRLKNDGSRYNTVNNQSSHRWVDPIRDKKDIENVKKYFQDKIDNAERADRKSTYARNKLFFSIGINSGYRVSDLITLKWKDVFNKNGSFKKWTNRKEQKTGKIKPLYVVEAVQEAFQEYINLINPSMEQDDYIFITRKELYELYDVGEEKEIIDCVLDKREKLNHNGLNLKQLEDEKARLARLEKSFKIRRFHVTNETIDKFMKEVTRYLNLEGNYAARSIRKTFAYQYYIMLVEKGDPLALVKVQRMLNHRSQETTLTYLGLTYSCGYDEVNELRL